MVRTKIVEILRGFYRNLPTLCKYGSMFVFSYEFLKAAVVLHRRRSMVSGFVATLLMVVGGLGAKAEDAPLPDSPGAVVAMQEASHGSVGVTSADDAKRAEPKGQQSKRIFFVIPNYRTVSVGDKVAPLSAGEKFKIAVKNSFDYSTFVEVGLVAGLSQARDTYPEFHQGGAGYGRRYWHDFTDQTLANVTTIFLLPVITREDTRYYTLGHGTFKHRAAYAVSRLVITQTDSRKTTANISEIVGRGAYAGISTLYYPARYHTFSETAQRWGLALGVDAGWNCVREFWPEIRYKLTGDKD